MNSVQGKLELAIPNAGKTTRDGGFYDIPVKKKWGWQIKAKEFHVDAVSSCQRL